MKFDTGRFLIKNAYSGNLAVLSDANHSTDLRGAIPGLDDDIKGEKWNIILLSTKNVNRYKIQNYDFASYASCDSRPGGGETIQGKTGPRQWIIKETNRSGQYTISTGSDPELHWGLGDGEDGTPVELSTNGSDPHNQWSFERVSDLEDCVLNLESDSRSVRLKALEDFPALAATRLETAIKGGSLATVIKLLSDSDTLVQATASTCLANLGLTVFPHTIVDLYEWKPIIGQLRALKTIIDLALVDQIKAAAVQSYLIPHLVKLLQSNDEVVVGKALEALTVLLSYAPVRVAAQDAQATSVLQHLVASNSSSKEAAAAALALVGSADLPSSAIPITPSHKETPDVASFQHPPDPHLISKDATATSPPLALTDYADTASPPTSVFPTPKSPYLGETSALFADVFVSEDSQSTLPDVPFRPLTPTGTLSTLLQAGDEDPTSGTSGVASIDNNNSIARPPHRVLSTPAVGLPEELVDRFDVPVESLVALLQDNNPATQRTAAASLQEATRRDTTARSIALSSGAMPILAKILTTNSDNLTAGYVIQSIANIASSSAGARQTAIKCRVFPSLLRALSSPTLRGQAARAVRELSREHLKSTAPEAVGAVLPLIELLGEEEERDVRLYAAVSLGHLAVEGSFRETIWNAGPLAVLLRMLDSSDIGLQRASTYAIHRLAVHRDARTEIGESLARLIKLLACSDRDIRDYISSILSRLFEDEHLREQAFEAGVISPLVQLIQSADHLPTLLSASLSLTYLIPPSKFDRASALITCIPALIKLCDYNKASTVAGSPLSPGPLRYNAAALLCVIPYNVEGQKAITEVGGIRRLATLLSHHSVHIREGAATALAHICTFNSEARQEVLLAGALPNLVALVDSHNPSSRLVAVTSLEKIFTDEPLRVGIPREVVTPLIELATDAKMPWPTRTKSISALVALYSVEELGTATVSAARGLEILIPWLPAPGWRLDPPRHESEDPGRTAFRLEVCMTLKIASSSHSEYIQAITLGAISNLIEIIRKSPPPLSECAESALSSIIQNLVPSVSALSKKYKAALRATTPNLVDILQLGELREHALDIKINAAACLEEIAVRVKLPDNEYGKAVTGLHALLKSDDESVQYHASRAIKRVIDYNSDARTYARLCGVGQTLEVLAKNSGTERVRTHAGSALASLTKFRLFK